MQCNCGVGLIIMGRWALRPCGYGTRSIRCHASRSARRKKRHTSSLAVQLWALGTSQHCQHTIFDSGRKRARAVRSSAEGGITRAETRSASVSPKLRQSTPSPIQAQYICPRSMQHFIRRHTVHTPHTCTGLCTATRDWEWKRKLLIPVWCGPRIRHLAIIDDQMSLRGSEPQSLRGSEALASRVWAGLSFLYLHIYSLL